MDSLCLLLRAILVDGYGAKAAAGWTEAVDGTNKKIFRQGGGNQHYLRVSDNGNGTGGAKEALIRAGEGYSDIDTLTNPMPTAAQSALTENSLVARKSASADATARAWKAYADNKTLMFFASTGDSAGIYFGFLYGDFYSRLAADGYRTILIGRTTENSAITTTSVERMGLSGATAIALGGHFVQRNRNGAVGALNTGLVTSPTGGAAEAIIGGNSQVIAYPNGEDGGLDIVPLHIFDPTTAPAISNRGRLRGLYHCVHPASAFSDGDTFSGVGDFAGKTFEIVKSGASSGFYVIETSDTWEASS